MKTTFFKPVIFTMLAAGMLASCINDDDYGIVETPCVETDIQKNLEVSEVPASSQVAAIPANLQDRVIEAYVTSSDRGGNFYKSISFQTLDGSKGFSVPVDVTSTFLNFEPGRKVFIKLQGLYTDNYNGIRIGDIYLSSGQAQVGRLPEAKYRTSLVRSCTVVNEEELVRPMTITQALNDANLNTLIDLQNVQFEDGAVGRRYYDNTDQVGGATNHDLIDATGARIIFRTSSFAEYAPKRVPEGSGTVRGVLTKFGSDYQFIARTEADVMLDGERFEIDFAPPIVGTNLTFGTYNENFESYTATNNRIFPTAINDPAVGSRYWEVKTFGGNKYIQMTSFGGTPETNRTFFIIPVNLTGADVSFQSKFGFSNGPALKVYYTTAASYTAGGNILNATLNEITSQFTLSPGSASGYPTNFTNSGVYAIPGALGDGYIVFEYVGAGGGITTTVQLDNIVIN
jgi:hypothetical protein